MENPHEILYSFIALLERGCLLHSHLSGRWIGTATDRYVEKAHGSVCTLLALRWMIMSTRFVRFLVENVRARNGDCSKVGGTVVSMEYLPYIFSLIDMDYVFSSTGKALRVVPGVQLVVLINQTFVGSHSNIDGYSPLVTAVLPLLFRNSMFFTWNNMNSSDPPDVSKWFQPSQEVPWSWSFSTIYSLSSFFSWWPHGLRLQNQNH